MSQLLFNVIKLSYTNPVKSRKDDTLVREVVEDALSSRFNLIRDFTKFPSTPSILVCNYCYDRMENIACILFPANLAIMMRDSLKRTTGLHHIVKWPIFTTAKGNYENSKKEVNEHMRAGRYIFAYVTKYSSLKWEYITIRSGMFKIAKELGVPVTPVCIDYVDTKFGAITYQNFHMDVGDTFMVQDVGESMQQTKRYFKETMIKFKQGKYKLEF